MLFLRTQLVILLWFLCVFYKNKSAKGKAAAARVEFADGLSESCKDGTVDVVVTGKKVEVRAERAADSDKLGTLAEGDEVTVISAPKDLEKCAPTPPLPLRHLNLGTERWAACGLQPGLSARGGAAAGRLQVQEEGRGGRDGLD